MDPIRSIVVATDFSPRSKAAERRAVSLALPDQASIHLVHVLRFPLIAAPYEVTVPGAVWEGVRSAARREMEAAHKSIEAMGVATVTDEISELYDPAQVIDDVVEERQPDLVVMATHGRSGLRHVVMGSVTERTLRNVRCPVLAVKEDLEQAGAPIRRILLAVDFSVHSDRAVEATRQLARRLHASVDVIHAFDFPADCLAPLEGRLTRQIEEKAGKLLEGLQESLADTGVPVSLHLQHGYASEIIAKAAEALETQLIVMGRRGHGGLSRLLMGSVAERTIRAAPCSLLSVQVDEG